MIEKIEINLVGVDSRTEAALKLIFSRHTQYVINHYAEFALVDAESMDGRQYLSDRLKQNDIIITVFPDKYDHAYILSKPLNAKKLLTVIESAAQDRNRDVKVNPLAEGKQAQVGGKESTGTSQRGPELPKGYEANPFAKYSDESYLKARMAEKASEKQAKEENEKREQAREAEQKSAAEESAKRESAVKSESETITIAPIEERVKKNPLYRDVKSFLIPTQQERATSKLFGQNLSVNFDQLPAHLFYRSESHLHRYVLEGHNIALHEGKNVVIELDNDYIYLDIHDSVLYTSLPEGSLYALSLMPINQEVAVYAVDSYRDVLPLLRGHRLVYYSEYGWLISLMILWSARGRLPEGFKASQEYYLVNDYDFFLGGLRLDEFQALKALWSNQRAVSMDRVVKAVAIPHEIILSFFSLLLTLGLLEADEKKVRLRQSELHKLSGYLGKAKLPSPQELLDQASHGLDALLKELKDI